MPGEGHVAERLAQPAVLEHRVRAAQPQVDRGAAQVQGAGDGAFEEDVALIAELPQLVQHLGRCEGDEHIEVAFAPAHVQVQQQIAVQVQTALQVQLAGLHPEGARCDGHQSAIDGQVAVQPEGQLAEPGGGARAVVVQEQFALQAQAHHLAFRVHVGLRLQDVQQHLVAVVHLVHLVQRHVTQFDVLQGETGGGGVGPFRVQ